MFSHLSVCSVITFLPCLLLEAYLTPLFFHFRWKKDVLWKAASYYWRRSAAKDKELGKKTIKSLNSTMKSGVYFCLLHGFVAKFKVVDNCYSTYLPPGRDSMSAFVSNLFFNSWINVSYLFVCKTIVIGFIFICMLEIKFNCFLSSIETCQFCFYLFIKQCIPNFFHKVFICLQLTDRSSPCFWESIIIILTIT